MHQIFSIVPHTGLSDFPEYGHRTGIARQHSRKIMQRERDVIVAAMGENVTR